jgi:hypothetical protein
MLYQVHAMEGWNQFDQSIDQISCQFWTFERTINTWNNEERPILDNTCCNNLPTKTQKVVNPFCALSDTYYGMMETILSSLLAKYRANSGHLMQL